MATFHYIGRNIKGQKVRGFLKAENLNTAVEFLEKQHIIPLHLDLAQQGFNFLPMLFSKQMHFFETVALQELLGFCRSIAALEEAGIPIVDAIKQLALSSTSKTFASILNEVADEIVAGKTLAGVLRNYPHVFPSLFTNLVEVGENTGNLGKTFLKLSSYLEMEQTNRRRLASTVRYPITVMVVIIAAAVLANTIVIPKFSVIFTHFKGQLPLPTRVIVGSSAFVSAHWAILLITILLLVIVLFYSLRIPQVRLSWDKNKFSLPIFGSLQRRIVLLQFTWVFSMILRAGLPLIKGLELAANATGNSYFKQQTLTICEDLKKGENLTNAASISGLFPPAVLQLLSAGEKSGKIEEVLDTVTDYYEREIDYDIKRVNDLIEPILLIIVGAMVLVFALGIYLPMWELIKFTQY